MGLESQDDADTHASKRRKLGNASAWEETPTIVPPQLFHQHGEHATAEIRARRIAMFASSTNDRDPITSLERSITPPKGNKIPRELTTESMYPTNEVMPSEPENVSMSNAHAIDHSEGPKLFSSPIKLTHIRDLPSSSNVDTVGLNDIIGDPLIKECWQFNYLFNIDFLMNAFDEDVRALVKVKVVHGSWKQEDPHRVNLQEAAKRYPNVSIVTAYMPEPFGTHHSKMMILIRHDGLAQVIIHTANMIPQDWTNMSQAVWQSPLLPILPEGINCQPSSAPATSIQFGSGARFKSDLLAYLRAYGQTKTGTLVKQLQRYDFGKIRAALVASTPCKQSLRSLGSDQDTEWGWPALKRILAAIPPKPCGDDDQSQIVIQVSSIASLGQNDKWLAMTFFDTLSATPIRSSVVRKPKFNIIFPTADEIRLSLDGYQSGNSIHMKIQSAAQAKQVAYMKPMLCHWAGTSGHFVSTEILQAGRRRAAPHIKTYIRFTDSSMRCIDWAMLTSANLSTQAWGATATASGEVRICSWEIGVVIWPGLWDERTPQVTSTSSRSTTRKAVLVPVFRQDRPPIEDFPLRNNPQNQGPKATEKKTIVGFRMPYDLPLVPYGKDDIPWCATSSYSEPDWMGCTYGGFSNGS
ncbi:MAG: tyrosyl-DNA phosphodiesterase 1 [Pycnora praestabilis]|nr:MAG: tyrosyl-DNA phosphodiesterase 1 [Pycnora praestabilis]